MIRSSEDVAAWGLFEKRDVETLQRVAGARTMDGYKIRAKLALSFPRAVAAAEAEETMMQYARAFAAAVECELSNGDLPFDEKELHQRITDQVQALPKKNVRLIGLHVWHKGAASSRSMLAVKPGPDSNPTVPAMVAVSQAREKPMSADGAHTATTLKPPDQRAPGAAGPSRAPARPNVAASMSSMPAAAPASRTPAAAPPSSPAVGRPAVPVRPPASPSAPAARSGAAAGGTRTAAPPFSPTLGSALPAAARMVSGVVPAVEPRIVRTNSGFALALEGCPGDSGEALGRALAQPVRDAAADVLLSTLSAVNGSLTDPLSLLDGRLGAELRGSLVGEACVYVCYVLYEALTRTSLPQMQAIQVVQGACVHALHDQNMPVSEISRYLATESPREEYSGRICTLLGVRETPEMQQRVEAHLRALRLDVRSCIEQIEQRLARAKASGQRG